MNQSRSSTPSSSSQRLPSFRGMDNSIQNVLLSKAKTNKKNYIPNLSVSRNVQPKVCTEGKSVPVNIKREPGTRDNPRSRREQKILAPVETLVPSSDSGRSALSLKSKSKSNSACSGIKHESIDRNAIKKVFNRQVPEKFEGISSASSEDLPVSVPNSGPSTSVSSTKKINPLLGDILKVDAGESPLFLMKTPKYIPAVLDNSENHPKIASKDDKTGYKCTIHDLPEGQIGKLQILKSGKLRLVLGDCKFWLNRGVNVNFREELALVKTDPQTKNGEIISLGEIKERIMVVPEIVTKLKS